MTYVNLVDSPVGLVFVGLLLIGMVFVTIGRLYGFSLRSAYWAPLIIFVLTVVGGYLMTICGNFHDPWAFILIVYAIFNVAVAAPLMLWDMHRHPSYYLALEMSFNDEEPEKQ